MNLTTIIAKTRSNLLESGTGIFFQDSEITDWINEGYMNYILSVIEAKQRNFMKTASIDWIGGTATYALPSDVQKIERVQRFINNTYVPMKYKHRFEEANSSLYQAVYPKYDLADGNIIFEPTPTNSAVGAVVVDYVYIPARLSVGTDIPHVSFPDVYHDMLVLYATICGLMKERDNPMAASYSARLEAFEKKFTSNLEKLEDRVFTDRFNLEADLFDGYY